MNETPQKPESNDDVLSQATTGEYKYGFTSDIDTEIIPAGLSEEVIRLISAKRASPSGCSISASRPTATGLPLSRRLGLTSQYRQSISRP